MTQDGIEPAAYADLQQDIADVVAATRAAASRSQLIAGFGLSPTEEMLALS